MKKTTKICAVAGIMLSIMVVFLMTSTQNEQESLEIPNSVETNTIEIAEITPNDIIIDIKVPTDEQNDDKNDKNTEEKEEISTEIEVEQVIQPDVVKPTYTEEQLTNPDQKPNGEPATEADRVGEETVVVPQISEPTSNSGFPGFDTVIQGGANVEIQATDMYENGNKVGSMG